MMSSEEYEVLYTLRSELAKAEIGPGVFGTPVGFGRGGCGGPGGFRPWGFGPWGDTTAWGAPNGLNPGRFGSPQGWMKDVTPAEMGVLMTYEDKGRQRAAIGGIIGVSAMAGVWKVAALGGFVGIAGMLVGGAVGARVSVRTSGLRQEMLREMIKLPSERSPRASQAREILRTKLQHNAFAQELLKKLDPQGSR